MIDISCLGGASAKKKKTSWEILFLEAVVEGNFFSGLVLFTNTPPQPNISFKLDQLTWFS